MPRRSADESARKETALEALHLAMRVTGRKQRPRPGKPGFEAVEQVMQWWRADWAERTPAQREADLRTASSWAKVRQRREAQIDCQFCPGCGVLCKQLITALLGPGDYYLIDETYAHCKSCDTRVEALDEE